MVRRASRQLHARDELRSGTRACASLVVVGVGASSSSPTNESADVPPTFSSRKPKSGTDMILAIGARSPLPIMQFPAHVGDCVRVRRDAKESCSSVILEWTCERAVQL